MADMSLKMEVTSKTQDDMTQNLYWDGFILRQKSQSDFKVWCQNIMVLSPIYGAD